MSKKSLFTILAILIIPVALFFGLTMSKDTSITAEANGKPQILKFSSTMCMECKQVEKMFQNIMPKYQDKITYTEIIVDSGNDMKNSLIKKYNVSLVPTIILINSDGTQVKRIEGAIPEAELEGYIGELK